MQSKILHDKRHRPSRMLKNFGSAVTNCIQSFQTQMLKFGIFEKSLICALQSHEIYRRFKKLFWISISIRTSRYKAEWSMIDDGECY